LVHREKVRYAEFSPNGQWLATASKDAVRIWELSSGFALTPNLYATHQVYRLTFQSASEITAGSKEGEVTAWRLDPDDHPVSELKRIANLLRGRSATWDLSRLDQFQNDWSLMCSNGVSRLQPSKQEIAEWHLRASDDCAKHENWPGAILHLKQLEGDAEHAEAISTRRKQITEAQQKHTSTDSSRQPDRLFSQQSQTN